ncbi:MAG: DUF4031 domain-containing protein [Acidimicrobiales bacterium]
MALYVDRLIDYTGRVPYRHKVWCHLVADTDDELLAAASELGAAEEWMQGRRGWDTHFDVPAPWREEALAIGAHEVDFRFMALRTRSRRAAMGLAAGQAVGAPAGSAIEVPLPGDGWRVERAPEGVTVAWRDDHPLLVGRRVAVLCADADCGGVVSFAPGEAGDGLGVDVAAVWSSRARSVRS